MLRGAGDFVSVTLDSRRKPVPVDAFPVAARRVVHDEPAGDHERVVACLARERPLLVKETGAFQHTPSMMPSASCYAGFSQQRMCPGAQVHR